MPPPAIDARKAVILCVDDEKVPLLVRSRVLEKAGHEVLSANSAVEALELLQSHLVDLVLTDLLMPGMNGEELAREVKTRLPSMPVVLFSGVNQLPSESSRADLFVSKLEGPDYLCQKIAEILGQFQSPAADA
ncbi:MAG TPA: response regulator [Silvibacterium sp.]|nr:response regulator [Silvibacterium sp.]